ncbi:homologous recombination OB-fold protein isoform X2 [Anser cygnoides]|uniref:homologous recombination OB-fold protein isoform X2 n=1 Tax=Anser cygnoides TaxID=8845 RepID=UPI0034D1ABA2
MGQRAPHSSGARPPWRSPPGPPLPRGRGQWARSPPREPPPPKEPPGGCRRRWSPTTWCSWWRPPAGPPGPPTPPTPGENATLPRPRGDPAPAARREAPGAGPRGGPHGAGARGGGEGAGGGAAQLPQPPEEDFGKGPWLTMKAELGLDERDPSCFLRTYSVVMVLRKAALRQLPKNKVPSMAVMIKSLTRTNVDAGAVFRDPTGEMQGTVHRLLLEERQGQLKPGAVLLLKQVGVFSPSHRNHYLNVTPANLLRIYPPEPEGSLSQPEVPAPAGSLQEHPAPIPRDLPGPADWGPPGTGSHGPQQPPGGSGCSHGATSPGTGSTGELTATTWMTWTGSWESSPRISSRRRPKPTAAERGEGSEQAGAAPAASRVPVPPCLRCVCFGAGEPRGTLRGRVPGGTPLCPPSGVN